MNEDLQKLIEIYEEYASQNHITTQTFDDISASRVNFYDNLEKVDSCDVVKECFAYNKCLGKILSSSGVGQYDFGFNLTYMKCAYTLGEKFLSQEDKEKIMDDAIDNLYKMLKVFKKNPHKFGYKIGAIKNTIKSLEFDKDTLDIRELF